MNLESYCIMSVKNSFFILWFSLFSIPMLGQAEVAEQDHKTTLAIFQKEDTEYIKNWVENLITEEEMTPETTAVFNIITSYYGLKMKQLGEDPKLTKIEVIAQFNTLVNAQNKELKHILPTPQFERFSKFYDKLSWSVNKRLNQL